MPGKWRQLLPHFLAMLVIYFACIVAISIVFDVQNFWASLAIALAIAFVYPGVTRSMGIAPEVWERS